MNPAMIILTVINWLISRSKEGSTSAGLTGILAGFRQLVPVQYQFLVDAGIVLFAGLAVILKDKGRPGAAQVIEAVIKPVKPE